MIQAEQKQQNQTNFQSQIIQNNQLKRPKASEFTQNYRAYFNDVPELTTKHQILSDLFKRLDIRYDEERYPIPISIKLVDHSVNYQILQCNIQMVFFSMTIKIYNVKGSSDTHIFKNISMTKTGIYSTLFKNQKIVIKCLHLSQEKFEEYFIKAVQEYCILKIASNLKIGPSVNNIFGFDLIMYDDCIQFGMEQCGPIQSWNKSQTLSLKKKLHSLHQLHLVHQDIKPLNILFSSSLQECVFIDYGFSRVVAEDIGEKTYSTFMGSFGFCSPEMTRCFHQTKAFVDLYNNDVYCLNKTLNQLQKRNFSKVSKISSINQDDNHEIIYYDQFKQKKALQSLFLIYIKSQILINQNISQYKHHIIKNRQEFLEFFANIPLRWEYQLFKLHYLIDNYSSSKQPKVCMNFRSCFQTNTKFKVLTQNENQEDFRMRLSKGISQFQDPVLQSYLVEGNLKQLLLNYCLYQDKITLTQYYYYFIQFVDICGSHSTPQEKQQVSKIMIKLRKIQNKKKSFQNNIENCLDYFLHMFLQQNSKFILSMIPSIVSNLIIYQTYTEQQLLQIYNQICQLQLEPVFHITLLFRCYLIREWIIQRAISRYKFTNIIIDTQKIILTKVKQIVSQNRSQFPLLIFLERLFWFRIDHCLEIDIKKLSQQLLYYREQIDRRLYIELLLFININQLDSKKESDNLQEIRIHLENIYQYHKIIYFQGNNLDYSTLRILNFACEINISYTANDYYDKIKINFQDQGLISKYKFHYAVQYNNFCNNKTNIQEIFTQFLKYYEQISYFHDEEILSKLSKLIRNYKFKQYIKQQNQHQYRSKLQTILSFDRFNNLLIPLSKQCNNYDYNIVKYFRINYIYFQSIEQLPIPNKRKELENRISELKSMVIAVQCNTCELKCQKYINLLTAQWLLQQNFNKSLIAYVSITKSILNKTVITTVQNIQIQQAMFKLIRMTKSSQNNQQKFQCLYGLMEVIKRYDLFWLILAPHFQYEFFAFISVYLLAQRKNYFLFFSFHLSLIQFVSFFHSSPLLKFLNFITIKLAYCYLQQIQNFNDELKNKIINMVPYNNYGCRYINYFFSSCMRYQKRIGDSFNKILRFICKEIAIVHHQAKNIILGNIYYYRLSNLSKMGSQLGQEMNKSKFKRYKAKIIRNYLKFDVFILNKGQFENIFLLRKWKRRNMFKNKLLEKIGFYYQNINEQNLKIIVQLGSIYHYISPFRSTNI